MQGNYVVQIRVNGYSNPSGKCKDDGICYPGREFYCCDTCETSGCNGWKRGDSYFSYCLKSYNSTSGSPQHCVGPSSANPNDGYVDFSEDEVLDLENPLNISGLDNAYEVSEHNHLYYV